MKLLFLALMVAVASAERLCPDGYVYAGEDTPLFNPRDYIYEEAGRTPIYSCYKVYEESSNWLSASHRCWDDDSQLVSFERDGEMERIVEQLFNSYKDFSFLTSGMRFHDVDKWYWVGSNSSISSALPIEDRDIPNVPDVNLSRDCLMFEFAGNSSTNGEATLRPVSCFHKASKFICESRVQTVTYYVWFTANWVDLLLAFLLVILFVALCVSVCSYTGSSGTRRSNPNVHATGRERQMTHATELPPSYDTAIKVEKGNMENPVPTVSRFDNFKNKGKELVAKVYYYRST